MSAPTTASPRAGTKRSRPTAGAAKPKAKANTSKTTQGKKHRSSSSLPAFITKLYSIVNASEACEWSADGMHFTIPDTTQFARSALAKHFKSAQFSSFVRQLHFYGFGKVQDSTALMDGALAFRHPSFRRDEPTLLVHIHRKTNSDHAAAQKAAQKAKLETLASQIAQLTALTQGFATQVAEAKRRAGMAEERAARAEQLMDEVREENRELRSRIDTVEEALDVAHNPQAMFARAARQHQPGAFAIDEDADGQDFWNQVYDESEEMVANMNVVDNEEPVPLERLDSFKVLSPQRKRRRLDNEDATMKPEPYSTVYEPPSNLAMSAFAAAAAMVAYQPAPGAVGAAPLAPAAPAPANWSEAKDIKQLTPDQLRQAYQVLLPAVMQQVQTMCCSDAKKNAAAAADCLCAAVQSQTPALVTPVATPVIKA